MTLWTDHRQQKNGIWIALAALVLCACSRSHVQHATGRLESVDADGDTVRLTAPATRVVSLMPSATDLVLALGDTTALVGRTRYDHDSAVAHLPSVGGGLDPDLETLTALHPDLVLMWDGSHTSRVARALTEEHIPFYTVATRDTSDYYYAVHGIGHLVGRDAVAQILIDSTHHAFAAVHAAVAGKAIPSVLFLMWGDPPMTIGPKVFLSQLIGVAGGRNTFSDAGEDWPRVSLEEIIHRSPDIIVLSVGEDSVNGAERLKTTPGWNALPAVRNGHVATISADLVDRPGPSMIGVVKRFQQIIHE